MGNPIKSAVMKWLASLFLVTLLSLSEGSRVGLSPERKIKMLKDLQGSGTPRETPPLANMTTPEIIQYFGYPAEIHHVITEDGYILEMHRIPYGIDGPTAEPRPVAFLQPSILCSSSDWVMDYPDRALAYLLADAGYDVWMNNVRGNTYSRNHTTLDPDGREFWQFTWDDSAMKDVTAAIDFALATTGQSQVYYVGFSVGSTMFFALMSDNNEYADKVVAAAMMAPVAYAYHMKGPMRVVANFSDDLDSLMTLLGHSEVLPSGPFMDYLAEHYCEFNDTSQPMCENLLFLLAGFDPDEMNEEWLPIVLSHTPAGTSIHTINHIGQLVTSGNFQNYDWGLIGNNNHYGSNNVPFYNLSVNTPPIALYWGQNDWLATPEDLVVTAAELTNVVVNHRVEWDTWNHLDFVWGLHAKEYVYDYVLDFLSQY